MPQPDRDRQESRTPGRLGICQWFHYEDDASLEMAVDLLRELGIRHLRTGMSWADFLRPDGEAWYDRQMAALAEFDVLLSIWHTPPSLAEGPTCAAPPRRLRDYADFIDQIIDRYDGQFDALELWNEPNNRYKWDFRRFDEQWEKFGRMIVDAGYWARQQGITTVLGGMAPVDPAWVQLMASYGVLDQLDVVAIHGFPGMWWEDAPNWEWYDHWHGWSEKVEKIQQVAPDHDIWITETGLATWDLHAEAVDRLELQSTMLRRAAHAPADRIYWYSLIDLDPSREAIEGFHVDENEYHMGLVTCDGVRKPAFEVMKTLVAEGGTRERARM